MGGKWVDWTENSVLLHRPFHGFFQLLTWTSSGKSVDTTKKSAFKLMKLPRLNVIRWKLMKIHHRRPKLTLRAFGKIQSGAPTSHSGAHVRRSQLIFLFQAVNLCFSTVSGYYSKICLLNEFICTKGKQKLTQLNKRNWDIYYTDLTCRYIWIN